MPNCSVVFMEHRVAITNISYEPPGEDPNHNKIWFLALIGDGCTRWMNGGSMRDSPFRDIA
jgi:hypothetical protein